MANQKSSNKVGCDLDNSIICFIFDKTLENMKNVRIIFIPSDYHNARKLCEKIQATTFPNFTAAMDFVKSEMGDEFAEFDNQIFTYDLNNLMDEVNDQVFDVWSEHFMSYFKFEQ